jgi:pimeloyl-ACP methyl ester carboxylesterase
LVLPGFAAADPSTLAIRKTLGGLGYSAHGWGLGRNHGDHRVLLPGVIGRVQELADAHSVPVALVGWSLGGMFAREAARRVPEQVRSIVTLGTPVSGGGRGRIDVPITAIFSKRDAVVGWRHCMDPNPGNRVQYVEVDATHFELGVSPEVLARVAHALAS